MDVHFRAKLRRIHRINRLLWASIFSGMVGIVLITLVLKFFNIVSEPVSPGSESMIDQILLIIAVLLAFLILYLKRTYLLPEKLVLRAKSHELNIEPGDVTDFVQEFGKEGDLMAKTLIIMRRYFMVVWSLANLIVIIGFIDYILALQFGSFLVFSIVGFYSMTINFPLFSLVEKCYESISE
ncbi:MAG: hypothetical protein AB7W47_12655 [Calditrichaceae bacterium]